MFTTIDDVWKVIDANEKVYWTNDLYALTIENTSFKDTPSYREGLALRVTCLSNGFGSFLDISDLPRLYVKP